MLVIKGGSFSKAAANSLLLLKLRLLRLKSRAVTEDGILAKISASSCPVLRPRRLKPRLSEVTDLGIFAKAIFNSPTPLALGNYGTD